MSDDTKRDDTKRGGAITSGLSEREQVERTADRLRDELLLTLQELDRRRERAFDMKFQVRQVLERNRELLLKIGAGALTAVAVGVGVSFFNGRRQERVVWERRRRAVWRAWNHPDQVASSSKQQPFAIELGRKLFFIFGTALASALARNAVQTLVPSSTQAAQKISKRPGVRFVQAEAHA
ncbi:hypothetical protein [Melittangium boletus]|uniref:Uncharacterized protein n=1 Tax=Melittangium boletus DSM 14713 TaxID=1294270 RepID=A0A250IBP3_9BACT|nr:hypothetical protein [Melittangium boletus]ATB29175.1 hypothetical protein MEBOL_002624 [Melittangium boletus DSM 14713]